MTRQVTCGSCRRKLLLPGSAGSFVTCPHCLMVLDNPMGKVEQEPRAVVPISRQVDFDLWWVVMTLIVLAILFFVSIIFGTTLALGSGVGVIVLLLGGAGAVVFALVRHWQAAAATDLRRRPNVHETTMAAPVPLAEGPTVLSYQSRPSDRVEHFSTGAFVGGFFGSLAICGMAFLMLISTVESPQATRVMMFGIVIAALIGVVVLARRLGFRPGWSGVGRGVTVGLTLGMMALGPCAGCYLIFLFE